jgi:hypothetical protein
MLRQEKLPFIKLQRRVIRAMSGVGPRFSCRTLFRKLNILPIACQYVFSLMLFTVDNQKDFLTNACVHGLDTRNKNLLYIPVVSLSCVQKGVSYSGIKFFIDIILPGMWWTHPLTEMSTRDIFGGKG